MKKSTLRFSAALKTTAPTAFVTMVKPVGGVCNLLCNYCYYLDKERLFDRPPHVMNDELLEEYTRQYIEANQVPEVTFCWHGGEPLVAGMEFYRKALDFQKKYAAGKTIYNTLQTNATLLTDDWAKFFADEKFLLGVSIDGPRDVHDANRVNKGGEPTFDKVLAGIEKLQRAGAEFNTLSAVSAASAGRGGQIYKFLKSIGSHYMQFLPVSEQTKIVEGYERPVICAPDDPLGTPAPWAISARDYGCFLVDIFDEWMRSDVGTYYVQMFDATLAGWCGVRAGVCSMNETCGDALVVEHDGSVYSCDHFVYPEHRLGNILADDLQTMFRSRTQFAFGAAKSSALPKRCTSCAWLNLCYGECPKHRFGASLDGEGHGVNSLCSGLQYFFRHSAPAMQYMRDCLEKGIPPATVMTARLGQ